MKPHGKQRQIKDSIKKPRDCQINARTDAETYAKLVIWCDKAGMTISRGVDLIVQEKLFG